MVDVNTNEFVVGGIDDGEGVDGGTDNDCVVETGVVVIDSVVVEQTVFGTICQSQAFLSNQLKIELKKEFISIENSSKILKRVLMMWIIS